MTEVRFHRGARVELDAAVLWYETRRPDLGVRFLEAIRTTLRLITSAPHGGTRWRGRADVHVWPVPRFPFLVAYVVEPPVIVVLAVAHTKRRAGYWTLRSP